MEKGSTVYCIAGKGIVSAYSRPEYADTWWTSCTCNHVMNTYIGCGDKAVLIFNLVYGQTLGQVAVTCIWLLPSASKIYPDICHRRVPGFS